MNIDAMIINEIVAKQIQQYLQMTKLGLRHEHNDSLRLKNQVIYHVYVLKGNII